MVSLRKLSVRWKASLPMGIVSLLMVAMVILGLTNTSTLSNKVNEISHGYLPSISYILQADRDLYQALVAERSMIFVAVKSEKFAGLRQSHEENVGQARERVEKFAAISVHPEALRLVEQFRVAFDTWRNTTNEIVVQRAADTRTGRSVAIDLSFGLGAEQFTAMRDTLDSLQDLLLAAAEQAREQTDQTVSTSRFKLLTALMIGLAFSCAFFLFAPGLITRPLADLSEGIRRLSHGDLSARVEVGSDDEFGHLGRTFNEFAGKQQELIKQVQDAVEKLRGSAADLAVVADQTSGGVNRQKVETEQVATAMHQMSATVQEIARTAVQTAQSTTNADEQATSGKDRVESTIASIRKLADGVECSASVIEKLKAESTNIGGVLEVIRNIAEQTNLLALNAAIEAARAGEQGRGFAVVADEVRTLAQRTQQSTKEIETMIRTLRSGTDEAVGVMEASRDRAHETVRTGAEAGELLVSVVQAVGEIRDMNHQVANATEEQSQVTDEINQGVAKIQKVAEETSVGADQTAQASAELSRLGETLQQMVSHFNVTESTGSAANARLEGKPEG